MNMYEVVLISSEGQRYVIREEHETEQQAIEAAFNKIAEKGWDIYEYRLYGSSRIR